MPIDRKELRRRIILEALLQGQELFNQLRGCLNLEDVRKQSAECSRSSYYNEGHNHTEYHQLNHDELSPGNHLATLYRLRNRIISRTATSSCCRGEPGVGAILCLWERSGRGGGPDFNKYYHHLISAGRARHELRNTTSVPLVSQPLSPAFQTVVRDLQEASAVTSPCFGNGSYEWGVEISSQGENVLSTL